MDWGQILTLGMPVLLLIVEYFLGKTDKVESNSILEIVEKVLKVIAGIFTKKIK